MLCQSLAQSCGLLDDQSVAKPDLWRNGEGIGDNDANGNCVFTVCEFEHERHDEQRHKALFLRRHLFDVHGILAMRCIWYDEAARGVCLHPRLHWLGRRWTTHQPVEQV